MYVDNLLLKVQLHVSGLDKGHLQVVHEIHSKHSCTCFEHHVLIIRRSKSYYTASGIITPVRGRPVHRLRGVEAYNELLLKQDFVH
jgi:hypothetical protein